MPAQQNDLSTYDVNKYEFFSTPLEDYFRLGQKIMADYDIKNDRTPDLVISHESADVSKLSMSY
jgi:hypothetical protein